MYAKGASTRSVELSRRYNKYSRCISTQSSISIFYIFTHLPKRQRPTDKPNDFITWILFLLCGRHSASRYVIQNIKQPAPRERVGCKEMRGELGVCRKHHPSIYSAIHPSIRLSSEPHDVPYRRVASVRAHVPTFSPERTECKSLAYATFDAGRVSRNRLIPYARSRPKFGSSSSSVPSLPGRVPRPPRSLRTGARGIQQQQQ